VIRFMLLGCFAALLLCCRSIWQRINILYAQLNMAAVVPPFCHSPFAIFHFRLSLPLFVCCYCCKTQLFMHVTSFSANQQQQQQQQQDGEQLE